MVKECLVILNNEAVTVVKYDDKDIQFPSIRKDAKTVFVECTNGKYKIVDEKAKFEFSEKKRRSAVKKATVEEVIDNVNESIVEENV